MHYDIFISYKRRGTSSAVAAYLYSVLVKMGYTVFFDRKELRSGKFDEQLYDHIEHATDILILLEDTSLNAAVNSNIADFYKSDWFCMEIMHALRVPDLNVIPVMLDGYKMPDESVLPVEMKSLTRHQAADMDTTDVEEFCKKWLIEKEYLKAKPKNLSLQRQKKNNGASVGRFLFYVDKCCCNLYEFGELITTLTDVYDEEHPFEYPVYFAGEHRFKLINNDTCEEQCLEQTIEMNTQKWIEVEWRNGQNLWKLTSEIIKKEDDAKVLYEWGKGLFQGTTTHMPDLLLSFECLDKSCVKRYGPAKRFLRNAYVTLIDRNVDFDTLMHWMKKAVDLGNKDAMYRAGMIYEEGSGSVEKNKKKALEYYKMGVTYGSPKSLLRMAKYYERESDSINEELAQNYYEQSAELNCVEAQIELAHFYHKLYKKDRSSNESLKKSIKWLLVSEINGSLEGRKILFKIEKQLAKQSLSADEKLFLGELFYDLSQKYSKKSDDYYRKALAFENAKALYESAMKLSDPDYKMSHLKDAADKGCMDAVDEIIHMYERKYSVVVGDEYYINLLIKTANNNHKKSQYYLGLKYRFSGALDYLQRDDKKAFELFVSSQKNDSDESIDTRAIMMLALCYAFGWGTKRDIIRMLKCGWVSFKNALFFHALFDLIEIIIMNTNFASQRIGKFLSTHKRLSRHFIVISVRIINRYSKTLEVKLGAHNVSKINESLTWLQNKSN